jgi:hypothetical protein
VFSLHKAGLTRKQSSPYPNDHNAQVDLHRALAATIAVPGFAVGPGSAMACHEHPPGEEAHCVGWLMNQLGPGNNIALRLRMMSCENLGAVVREGPQHQRFEDILP